LIPWAPSVQFPPSPPTALPLAELSPLAAALPEAVMSPDPPTVAPLPEPLPGLTVPLPVPPPPLPLIEVEPPEVAPLLPPEGDVGLVEQCALRTKRAANPDSFRFMMFT
jgi:hypothetical protein